MLDGRGDLYDFLAVLKSRWATSDQRIMDFPMGDLSELLQASAEAVGPGGMALTFFDPPHGGALHGLLVKACRTGKVRGQGRGTRYSMSTRYRTLVVVLAELQRAQAQVLECGRPVGHRLREIFPSCQAVPPLPRQPRRPRVMATSSRCFGVF